MAERVLVRCPVCRREHSYTAPVYPCGCGAPVALPLLSSAAAIQVRHRTWAGSWISVRCPTCGRVDEWPQPELGCGCGTTLRVPVARGRTGVAAPPAEEPAPTPTGPEPASAARAPVPRPPFRPVTIRTAHDAKLAAAQYLRWLGFEGIRVAERTPASGVDVRGPSVVAHVDPSTSPAGVRDVETLWLNGLNDSVAAVCFALAGYLREARARADELRVPLFVLDLTGAPRAVNDAAEHLIRTPR
ncbi:hypothetical protein ACH4RA_22390 [Streptomyces smyrnaeus]|uniref:hypothetical protein n=1 Tax=Streptomyces TaxID=1883 RepID=UPI000C17DE52|nr:MULTISPECIES: hypothetical protein [unclassified Streptomyces]MBQ0864021.1 hypothetical protein [Streptomyces sp. RK75]MBQ1120055.1 hypothetical protein [Streptomyces sp. B15]MBQ1159445.1 hypothetical protein [Streptomyces sp. A73]